MNALLVGDLHLTSVPRDGYRWHVFPQIKKALESGGNDDLVLLGDLTDRKDNHPSELVNRICDELTRVAKVVKVVHVLRGNHDGVDPTWPYFRFLGHLPKVKFYSEPTVGKVGPLTVLFLPHSRNPKEEWSNLRFDDADVIFAHITVDGATAENSQSLSGVPASIFGRVPVYAGDVHVPQRVGKVTYVGAPYPIRFGDSFAGRFITLSAELRAKEVPVTNIRRLLLDVASVKEFSRFKFRAGDQVKVRAHLDAEADWVTERKAIVASAAEHGVDLVQLDAVRDEQVRRATAGLAVAKVTPDDIFLRYCSAHNVPSAVSDVGRDTLEEAVKGIV